MKNEFLSIAKKMNSNYIFFALIVLCPQITINAQTISLNKISSGLYALYNFQFSSSDKYFQDFINLNPDHSAGYYFKSIKNLWFYLDNKNEKHLNEFVNYTDTAIQKAELYLQNDSADVFNYFILGSVYYQRAVAHSRGEEYLNALWATKMFQYYFKRIVSIDSTYFDAYMCLGLYNFAVSQAPPSWKWALDLTGIEGDKRLGLEYLKSASEKGKYYKVDAKFYLSQLYSEFFLDFNKSEKYLISLTESYPENLLFRYALGNLQVRRYELKSAEKNFNTVLQSEDSVFFQLKNYSALALGDLFFTRNDFDSAKAFYHAFLDSSIDHHLKGIAALKLGLCYLFNADTSSALKYFDKADEGNLDLDEDIYAKIRGEQFEEILPDSVELSLIRYKNILDSGNFGIAIDSLEYLNGYFISDTLRAELMLYISEAFYQLKKYKQSFEYAVGLLNFENCENWVKAFACYNAGRASVALKNFEDAELFIEYASNYSDFFFENKLTDRLSALLYDLHD
jgi:tetratricopeptide (TPR) repeat protein